MVNVFDGIEGIIQPTSCIDCDTKIRKFYDDFLEEWNPIKRKELLKDILEVKCECHEETLKGILNTKNLAPIPERLAKEESLLDKELPFGEAYKNEREDVTR